MQQLSQWLTAKELAEYAGLPYRHLWTYRSRGILPMPDMYIGNKPLWSRTLIDSWDFKTQTIDKVSDGGELNPHPSPTESV
jgi:hypothetical protein